MSANRARNTAPELALRHALRTLGHREYRLHRRDVPGRPDISFGTLRLAVFVNGCFWHRCPRCQLPLPKSHTEFWRTKFALNQRRDVAKAQLARQAGWSVVTLWECEIRADANRAADRIDTLLRTIPIRNRGRLRA